MSARRSSSLLLILSAGLLVGIAWIWIDGSLWRVRIGRETWALYGWWDGVSFERSTIPGATRGVRGWQVPARGSWRPPIDSASWRTRLWMQRHRLDVLNTGIDVIVISYPWLIALAVLPAAIWMMLAHRRPRRRVLGTCPNCDYDLRATPDRCPECGQVLTPPSMLDRLLSLDFEGWRRTSPGRRGGSRPPLEVGPGDGTEHRVDEHAQSQRVLVPHDQQQEQRQDSEQPRE